MKNGALVTRMLDSNAEYRRLSHSGSLEDLEAALAQIESGIDDDLWQACLDDGWTIPELDAAFERRFGVPVKRSS